MRKTPENIIKDDTFAYIFGCDGWFHMLDDLGLVYRIAMVEQIEYYGNKA